MQKSGAGTGTVTSSPAGINCGSTCSANFTANTTVTLMAAATGGNSVFTGWSGACSGTAATCTVTMNAAKNVGVMFANIGATVKAISSGGGHTCALTAAGAVRCWGYNGVGQLGDGTTTPRLTPVQVSGLAGGVRAISAGANHTCALTAGGAVMCWGNNYPGLLGDGTTTNRLTPVQVLGLGSGVQAISASENHTCALTAGGAVRCWGFNGNGELGDGTRTDRLTSVLVSGLGSGVQAISTGTSHSCALTTGGGVKCWGYNSSGELGDGTTVNGLTVVQASGLGSGVQAISAGDSFTCALTTGGAVRCWGFNTSGQLGDGTRTNRQTSVQVSGLGSGVQAISAGASHACALIAGGAVRCWGYNAAGQLGDGTATSRLTSVQVSGLHGGIQAVSAGWHHACALTTGGAARCWGSNVNGQLGDGTTTNRLIPVPVSGVSQTSGAFHNNLRAYIPKDQCAVGRHISVSGISGGPDRVGVHIDISHPYPEDLYVQLCAPSGRCDARRIQP